MAFTTAAPSLPNAAPRRTSRSRRRICATVPSTADVVIIGAGLSGLSAARHLAAARPDLKTVVLEADAAVGGRVQTDVEAGCRFDRGFQVFIEAYPELRSVLTEEDRARLDLRRFLPGALVRVGDEFARVSDPVRQPGRIVESLLGPVGSVADKLKVGGMRFGATMATVDEVMAPGGEVTTEEYLRDVVGLSGSMVDRFFRPFYQGIFLASLEEQSSTMFRFVFKMFADGEISLPSQGMGDIPRCMAEGLDVHLNTPVASVANDGSSIVTSDGQTIQSSAVVVATDEPSSRALLGQAGSSPVTARGSTTVYYIADGPPPPQLATPTLVLNGDVRNGPVNNMFCPNAVADTYTPSGKSMISATVLGCPESETELEGAVRKQMTAWFGADEVRRWEYARSYSIPFSQPGQKPPNKGGFDQEVCVQEGLYVCGDHRGTATFDGALKSGRRAAQAVIRKLE